MQTTKTLAGPAKRPLRKDDRIILHFDYDCFYASVFMADEPRLRTLPLAVQQKQIIVTCNYEARRRGLFKLQPIQQAKKLCPEVVIVLGEDLTPFRNASKALRQLLRSFSWNGLVETLGLDEVFMDVSDMVDYNVRLLNDADLAHSFFCLKKDDPTFGFEFDASKLAGHAYDRSHGNNDIVHLGPDSLQLRLILGSHLAWYLRQQLEKKNFTSAAGISTSKLLSKLVGNVNKPQAQTTLLLSYVKTPDGKESNVTTFMDEHDVGKVPYIGFKMSHKLHEFALKQLATDSDGIQVDSDVRVTVRELRTLPGLDAAVLEKVLGGPGMQRDIGYRTLCLLHGVDDSEVSVARDIPRQISIEDSYPSLDSFERVVLELLKLSASLLRRMRTDLTEEELAGPNEAPETTNKLPKQRRWLAYPKTLRLSTRPRSLAGADASRGRAMVRITKSDALPTFVFNLTDTIEAVSEKLVHEHLVPLFRQLHPEKRGWNLSLINIGVTNMVETAGATKSTIGRHIGKMFKTQEKKLQPWKVEDIDLAPDMEDSNVQTNNHNEDMAVDVAEDVTLSVTRPGRELTRNGSEDFFSPSQSNNSVVGNEWYDQDWHGFGDEGQASMATSCPLCGAKMPDFAIAAHLRFHEVDD